MPPSSPLAAAAVPDTRGWFGDYGGRFAPEVLMGVLEELDQARTEALGDQAFNDEFHSLLKEVAGRPTPLSHAPASPARPTGGQARGDRRGMGGQARLCPRHRSRLVRPSVCRLHGARG